MFLVKGSNTKDQLLVDLPGKPTAQEERKTEELGRKEGRKEELDGVQ